MRGQVQGVGFRPWVYGLAQARGLSGQVHNDGEGVLIVIAGPEAVLGDFLQALLRAPPPPLARITAIETSPAAEPLPAGPFIIAASAAGAAITTAIPADAAVCPACLEELFDPAGRRWRYPFLTCTHCGPRWSISHRLPYDRPQTSMAGFALCPDCAREYRDPADRRFHAQPIACPACGPRLSHPVETVAAALAAGRIVALKGLGGYHLACDATHAEAVVRLRRLKQRDRKPFALMVANAASAARLVELAPAARALLESPARPVVLLRRRPEAPALAPGIAPDLAWLGMMLPYTPLHYLLFHEAAGRPAGTGWLESPQALTLVMTSANPGGEPLCIDEAEAERRLAGIAELRVGHDRQIVVRTDDSVFRLIAGAPTPIRRARGFVPEPVALARPVPPVLALGGHFKVTACVTRGAEAFLSQHIGDLDHPAAIGFLEEAVTHLLAILEVRPAAVIRDRHPDFHTSRLAEALARDRGIPCLAIQHHHAHVAAVMAEHGLAGPGLGLALDGVGLGEDGTAWGGELLRVEGGRCRRLGHLAPLPQPGGDAAARQPWRMAAAVLHRLGRGAEIARRFAAFPAAPAVAEMLARGVRCPPTTGCGRWFDAACGLLGVRPLAGFEGEAPMVLESLVTVPTVLAGGWQVQDATLDLLPLMAALLDLDPVSGANLFHGTLAAALADWVRPALAEHGGDRLVLSGGCLVNAVLAEALIAELAHSGITALTARAVPPNDGGLSLGQAWAGALTLIGDKPCCSSA